jgi:O-antigen ligase
MATTASLDMAKDYWPKGAGAGSFRFVFPLYQQRYPEIYRLNGSPLFWEHAHNDVVEIAVEQGVAGTVLILAALAWLLLALVRACFWENPLSGCIVFGALLLAGQAWWDFPFQCPAILMLWWSMLVLAVMWARFEDLNVKA